MQWDRVSGDFGAAGDGWWGGHGVKKDDVKKDDVGGGMRSRVQ